MSESLNDLLRGEVAHAVLRVLIRDLRVQVKRNAALVPAWAEPVLRALHEASEVPLPDVSVIGRAVGTVGADDSSCMVPVAEAAEIVGRSERQVRRLASEGRVLHRRVGKRSLLVDVESLRRVLDRAA